MESGKTIRIATRGSALALAQANTVLSQFEAEFPNLDFELKIIRTTGDKLQAVAIADTNQPLPKGLFTKELEVALLSGEADLAVHSLKDLPTELPDGLKLAAVLERADVRDVLIYRRSESQSYSAKAPPSRRQCLNPHATIFEFSPASTIATASTRREAQILLLRPDLKVVPIRGNVGTRLQKLADQDQLDGLVLALAGMTRLHFRIAPDGSLHGEGVPDGLLTSIFSTEEMLPCVGQGAIGLETRENDPQIEALCARVNHRETYYCVLAERAFLHAMGGGCLSPVAAYAEIQGETLRLRAASFREAPIGRGDLIAPLENAIEVGKALAHKLLGVV